MKSRNETLKPPETMKHKVAPFQSCRSSAGLDFSAHVACLCMLCGDSYDSSTDIGNLDLEKGRMLEMKHLKMNMSNDDLAQITAAITACATDCLSAQDAVSFNSAIGGLKRHWPFALQLLASEIVH